MLFLATFFPTWEGGAGVYDFVGVSVKLSHNNDITRIDLHYLTLLPAYIGGCNVCWFSRNL